MNKITCPKCGTVFQIDEDDYQSILKKVRDEEFDKEIEIHEKQHQLDKENAIKLKEISLEKKHQEEISQKEMEIQALKNTIKSNEDSRLNEIKLKEKEAKEKFSEEENKLKLEINDLKAKLKLKDTETEMAVKDAVVEKDKELQKLKNQVDKDKSEFLLKEKDLKDHYEEKIKDKEEQIAYYKDFKAKQSTKMIGESLEVHCSTEFNRLRPLFPSSTFEKDNDARTGSKGDFIFRDYDGDVELVSIMFEMKNEADATSTKHKNEDFLKELDKDRKEKKCEYAVLVSLLEADNDYYNDGIVDVSHLYDKMYVIRPQFFIPLITLIRNMARKNLDTRRELELIRNQNIDITNFEKNMNTFKDGFNRNYRLASERFSKAIEEIDKSIDHLQKIKEHLQKTDDNLRLANNKAQDLTIQKLTYNNPTMKEMFDSLEKQNNE